jgi:drug/metabolite transporter (DMT)-like permease
MQPSPVSVRRTETQAKLACALAGVVWGLFWIPLRALDAVGITGAWATAMLYFWPFVLLLPLVAWRWRRVVRGGFGLQLTGLITGLSLVLYADALIYTEVIRAMLLYYLTPVWSTLLARIFLKEPITLARWIAIALGFAGVLVIFGVDTGIPWPRNLGDWMGLAAGIVWAVAAVRMRSDNRNHAIEFTTVQFGWGTLLALGVAFLPVAGVAPALDLERVVGVLPWLLPVVLLGVIPGTFAAMWGTPLLNPGIVGILFMTEISVGAVTAALWAGEPFGAREIIGILLISGAGLAESLQAPFAWRWTKAGTAPRDPKSGEGRAP